MLSKSPAPSPTISPVRIAKFLKKADTVLFFCSKTLQHFSFKIARAFSASLYLHTTIICVSLVRAILQIFIFSFSKVCKRERKLTPCTTKVVLPNFNFLNKSYLPGTYAKQIARYHKFGFVEVFDLQILPIDKNFLFGKRENDFCLREKLNLKASFKTYAEKVQHICQKTHIFKFNICRFCKLFKKHKNTSNISMLFAFDVITFCLKSEKVFYIML